MDNGTAFGEMEIEISHTCPELEEEKLRFYEIGFLATITIGNSTDEEWEVAVFLHDRLGEDKLLISINNICVKCCPYCGTRLPILKEPTS